MNRLSRGILLGWFCAASALLRASTPQPEVANGVASTEWPAVGALIAQLSGGGFEQCTATLISPTWVLTAAHCLQDSSNPQDYKFVPQTDYSCCTASGGLAVSSVAINPAYNSMAHDQGLVQLASPAVGITPLPVNDQAAPSNGSYLHLLGYGLTLDPGNTLKQLGLLKMTGINSTTISFDSLQPYAQACAGDSGAPSFNYGASGFPIIYSTVSYGTSPACSTSTTEVSSRTDSDIAWILSHATDACLRSAPHGSGCDAIFRNGIESLAIAPAAPVITLQPVDQTIPGEWFASFRAAASGDPPPTVRWQASPNGTGFMDATGATSPLIEVYGSAALNGAHFRAVFSNALGSVTSNDGVLTVTAAQDYNPANCRAVANTLNIFWEDVGGSLTGCTGIEYTDGSLSDAADGNFAMNGLSASNDACITPATYTFALSPDKQTLSGLDTLSNVPMTLTLSSDHACYVGHWILGGDDYVATIWAFPSN